MAFVSKEDKANLSPAIKAVIKKYNMKGTIAVRNHSTLVVNLREGELDILGAMKRTALKDAKYDRYNKYDVQSLNHVLERDNISVNHFWIEKNYDCPVVVAFLTELKEAMFGPEYFDESDSMTDYFHCSHYIDINVGKWNKPYNCTGEVQVFAPVEVEVA